MSTEVTVAANSQQENPFQAHGELRQKADYIISHSRISRTEVQIADPDSSTPLVDGERAPPDEDDAVFIATSEEEQPRQEPAAAATVSAAKGTEEKEEARCGEGSNGVQSNSSAAPQPAGQTAVQVDVVRTEQKPSESPQRAEQVQLKKKKRCVLQ